MRNALSGPVSLEKRTLDQKVKLVLLVSDMSKDVEITSAFSAEIEQKSLEMVYLDDLVEQPNLDVNDNCRDEIHVDAVTSLRKRENKMLRSNRDKELNILNLTNSADLLVATYSMLDTQYTQVSYNLLKHTQCPILLLGNKWVQTKKIVILFDGCKTAIKLIKQLVDLRKTDPSTTEISVLGIHNAKSADIRRESNLVTYLVNNFTSVGVLSVSKHAIFEDIKRIANEEPIILLTGKIGAKLLFSSSNKKEILKCTYPLIYRN